MTLALCGVPAVAVTDAADEATFVKEHDAGFETPLTLALTLCTPAVGPAVSVGAVAMPLALVGLLTETESPGNRPEAKIVVNVTIAPATGLFAASRTIAARLVGNGVPTTVLWPHPVDITIVAAPPAEFVS